METSRSNPGLADIVLAVVLGLGCAACVPLYWWLFITPVAKMWRQLFGSRAVGGEVKRPARPG